jgi:hypothetical protein
MTRVLDLLPAVDVVVGRYRDRDYHGYLEYVLGEHIKEHRINTDFTLPISFNDLVPRVWKIEIGPNFFLARTEVLQQTPWDETLWPIGGEHVDFFIDLKSAGKIVAYLPSANINELPQDRSKEDPDYRRLRFRVWGGHELMIKKRNIKKYYGFDEEVK